VHQGGRGQRDVGSWPWDQCLLTKYARQVPRYTSYPTALQFDQDVDGGVYRGWLGAIPPEVPLSLYFHIPFCASMCWFCGCHARVVNAYRPIAGYLEAVMRELDSVADLLEGERHAAHVHWGGGTPTILSADDIETLAGRVKQRFAFSEETDFAVEIYPRTLTADVAGALARAGVNRASLGVQDLNDDVQRAVNRVQPVDMIRRAVDWLRDAGIQAINIDLMYGLPLQTVEGVRRTAETVLDLASDRIALFGYAHVPWMKRHQRLIDEATLPDLGAGHAQYEAVATRLAEAGYVSIGLDYFARPGDDLATAAAEGRLHRNFQGYTADDAPVLLGFGASAIGFLPRAMSRTWRTCGAIRMRSWAVAWPSDAGCAWRPTTARGARSTSA
jgi:oxygen-independent coproporphyrinogen-3 oxidase